MVSAEDVEQEQETLDGSPARIDTEFIHIKFQCGVIPEFKKNGATIREVIDVLVTRLRGFMGSERNSSRCRENAIAITKLQEARMWLDERERDRKERGVEGKRAK